MKCQHCQKEIPNDSKFCNSCGTPQIKAKIRPREEKSLTIPEKKIAINDQKPKEEPARSPQQEKTKEKKDPVKTDFQRLCERCGSEVSVHDQYCPSTDCPRSQELKFRIPGIGVVDRIKCQICGHGEELYIFFHKREFEKYFKTKTNRVPRKNPTQKELLGDVNKFQCPECYKHSKQCNLNWKLVKEPLGAKIADFFTYGFEIAHDAFKRLTPFLATATVMIGKGITEFLAARQKKIDEIKGAHKK